MENLSIKQSNRRQGRGYLYLIKWKDCLSAENLNNTFYMPKTFMKAIKTDTTFTEKPHPLKLTQPYMPHITELDLSKENKENIPQFMLHDNLNNLIDYFDSKFKDYESYSTYFCQQLPEWINETTFKLSDAYYCQHRSNLTTPTKTTLLPLLQLQTRQDPMCSVPVPYLPPYGPRTSSHGLPRAPRKRISASQKGQLWCLPWYLWIQRWKSKWRKLTPWI